MSDDEQLTQSDATIERLMALGFANEDKVYNSPTVNHDGYPTRVQVLLFPKSAGAFIQQGEYIDDVKVWDGDYASLIAVECETISALRLLCRAIGIPFKE